MKENEIDLKSINDLLDYNFFIPSYQRGYRWDKQQVTDLLNDLYEFAQKEKKKEEFYCLQPVVVKSKGNNWEVIDGQQRLTTIIIILHYFNQTQFKTPKKVFEIAFETRKGSSDFLQNINKAEHDKNVDYYHIYNALEYIKDWFEKKEHDNPAIANEFYPVLINSTKVIWYNINDGSDSRDIFTRINMGKIPLTNAELIKALFLKDDNFEKDSEIIRLKQLEIASEWDRIEYTLQNPEFWLFINKSKNNLSTRIEYIFNLIWEDARKKDIAIFEEIGSDSYSTFRYFNKILNGVSDNHKSHIESVWKLVKDYILTFEEWYNNDKLYHLVGYLISIGANILDLKIDSSTKTKSEFIKSLRKRIKANFKKCQLSELEYGKNNNLIIQLLLLLNIESILSNSKSYARFPFDKFKNENWSLEHIHAQNSDGLVTVSQWNTWLNEHVESLKRIDKKKYSNLIEEIEEQNNSDISKEEFDKLFEKVISAFNEKKTRDSTHEITNLTLLDKDSNSALNKAIFEIKRNRIIEREKTNSFVPICTRNIFLKYYTKFPKQLYYWSNKDRKDYLGEILKTIGNYLPEQEK